MCLLRGSNWSLFECLRPFGLFLQIHISINMKCLETDARVFFVGPSGLFSNVSDHSACLFRLTSLFRLNILKQTHVSSSWVQLVSLRMFQVARRVFPDSHHYSDKVCSTFYVFIQTHVPSSWVQSVSFRIYKINWRVFLNSYHYSDKVCSSFYVFIQTHVPSSWVQLVSFWIYKINWRVFLDSILDSYRYSDKVSSSFITLFRRTCFVHLFLYSCNPIIWPQALVQPIAFGGSFDLNLQSQSRWSLFNRTWQRRPRDLDHWFRFQFEEMTLLMQQAVQVSSSFTSIFRYTPVFFIYISIQTHVSFSITAQDTCTSKCLVLRDFFFFPGLVPD